MDQLPNHKVPKTGSPGDKYRDMQLIYQLPKQDLSETYNKNLLDETEISEFKIFKDLRDKISMDIGYVKESEILTVSFTGYIKELKILIRFF